MKHKILYLLLPCLAICGCQKKEENKQKPEHMVGMANPASVYCKQLHGQSITVRTSTGEYANCKLPSGEIIEEWALYRRDHPLPK